MDDKFKEWKLNNPIDRIEAYRWAALYEAKAIRAELLAIRKLLEKGKQK